MFTKIKTDPKLLALLEATKDHVMSDDEREAQRQSFVRAMTTPCEHGVLDFEQCAECRAQS